MQGRTERGRTMRRQRIWIDKFQTRLFIRVGMYCLVFQAAAWLLVLGEQYLRHLTDSYTDWTSWTFRLMFLVIASVVGVLLPSVLCIYDAVRLSHRVAGPLVRFRQAIREVAEGDEVELVRLRDTDFLQEMRDELNEMLWVLRERGAIELKRPGETLTSTSEKQSSLPNLADQSEET